MKKRIPLIVTMGLFFSFCQAPALVQTGGAAAQVLRDGFDASGFAEEGGLYYKENDEQAAGTVEFQSEVKRGGTGALKLTVRSLCPADAGSCSERAEIWEKTPLRVPYDAAVWYGFAVRFADPIPTDNHRYLIAQWKREIEPGAQGDFSPFLGFRFSGGRLFVTVETNYRPASSGAPQNGVCPDGTVPVWLRPETNQMRALVVRPKDWVPADGERFADCTDRIMVIDRGNDLPGVTTGWINFGVLSKPGPDGSGRIEIFANDRWIVTIKGMIGHSDAGLGPNQYFKFGPYRDGAPDRWTLYYDDFVRSPNCEDVLAQKDLCRMIDD